MVFRTGIQVFRNHHDISRFPFSLVMQTVKWNNEYKKNLGLVIVPCLLSNNQTYHIVTFTDSTV